MYVELEGEEGRRRRSGGKRKGRRKGRGGGVKGKRERRGVEEWKRGEKKERWMGREGEE